MKYSLLIPLVALYIFSACSTMIPMQANLNDQTLLLAKNKNLKVNYDISSEIKDGEIKQLSFLKNGSQITSGYYEYNSSTAFKTIWGEYFSSKYNIFSKDTIEVQVILKDIYLKTEAGNTIGGQLLTGNVRVNNSAEANIHIKVIINDETFENEFKVNASGYNESQTSTIGNYTYTTNQTNPMQQRAELLESAINKSILQFDNFMESLLMNIDG